MADGENPALVSHRRRELVRELEAIPGAPLWDQQMPTVEDWAAIMDVMIQTTVERVLARGILARWPE